MQIELGNAAEICLHLLNEALQVFSDMTGQKALVFTDNSEGNSTLVTNSSEFAGYFKDLPEI